jgi:small ubiquitin-related modifier
MAEDTGETKPKVEAGAEDGIISVRVKDQTGGEVVFKVKKTTKFSRILDAFCQKKAWDATQVRFVFDGQRLNRDATPEELDMESGDVSPQPPPPPRLRLRLRCPAPGPACPPRAGAHPCDFAACRPSTPSWSRWAAAEAPRAAAAGGARCLLAATKC